ncbi:hypothetical protein Tsp_01721 [Trichinella spiralis]|uniref:hypothetical protein n=1 Tax=Trichinella spiralis TaxID=6334 RepID=UPI0001EFC8A8|nr:hypothetical protein Tsp_01721 [Trichinella spiralis]
MMQSVTSDLIKDEEGYIEIPPVQFRKEAYFDLRSGHGATISCQSIKEELLPFVKSEENWQTQTHWYKKNDSNWQLVTVPSDMPQILQSCDWFRNLRFYGEDIEIASLLAGVHNGDYLCIVSIVNKSIAVAMNIRLASPTVIVFTDYAAYWTKISSTVGCTAIVNQVTVACIVLKKLTRYDSGNNDAFLHNRICWIPFFIIACVVALVAVVAFFASFARMLAKPYLNIASTALEINNCSIPFLLLSVAAGAAASAATLAPPVATAGPLGTLDNFVAPVKKYHKILNRSNEKLIDCKQKSQQTV